MALKGTAGRAWTAIRGCRGGIAALLFCKLALEQLSPSSLIRGVDGRRRRGAEGLAGARRALLGTYGENPGW